MEEKIYFKFGMRNINILRFPHKIVIENEIEDIDIEQIKKDIFKEKVKNLEYFLAEPMGVLNYESNSIYDTCIFIKIKYRYFGSKRCSTIYRKIYYNKIEKWGNNV